MARASEARFAFDAAAIPVLAGALDLARDGVETGGAAHNRRFVKSDLDVGESVEDQLVTLAHDPQTNGGLLAAVSRDRLDRVLSDLDDAGVPAWRVGRVEAGQGVALT